MIFPSEPGRHRTREQLEEELYDALYGAVRLASDGILADAVRMLQAQIASRRAMIVDLKLVPAEADRVAVEIQKRVERIRLIGDELRRRGQAVEWEE